MPLYLTVDGSRSECRLVRLADGSYELQGGEVAAPLICPLSLPADLDPAQYEVHVFFAGDARESDIYQLYVPSDDGAQRIGWFFSILALESNLHDFAENEHFLRYARAAIDNFFDVYPSMVAEAAPSFASDGGFTLTSFAPDSAVFLVVSKVVTSQGALFDLARMYPYLTSIGVLDEKQSKGGVAVVPFLRPLGGKVKLIHSTQEFADDNLVRTLLSYAAHAFNSPVLQFFYLYQVIELLMEKIFSIEQESIISKINLAKGEVSKVKEAMDDLAECISEKKRINAIHDKYCDPPPSVSDLVRTCRALNRTLGVKEGDTLARSLYPLRNLIFHNYRSFPDENLCDLMEVNRLFFDAIPRILASFRGRKGACSVVAEQAAE